MSKSYIYSIYTYILAEISSKAYVKKIGKSSSPMEHTE